MHDYLSSPYIIWWGTNKQKKNCIALATKSPEAISNNRFKMFDVWLCLTWWICYVKHFSDRQLSKTWRPIFYFLFSFFNKSIFDVISVSIWKFIKIKVFLFLDYLKKNLLPGRSFFLMYSVMFFYPPQLKTWITWNISNHPFSNT